MPADIAFPTATASCFDENIGIFKYFYGQTCRGERHARCLPGAFGCQFWHYWQELKKCFHALRSLFVVTQRPDLRLMKASFNKVFSD